MAIEDLTDEELLKMADESGVESAPKQSLQDLSDEELLALAEEAGVTTAPKEAEPVITSAESALRGAAQGVTLGFADEISAGIEASISDKPYLQARKESRENFAKAQEANPNAYIFGEVAGGIGTTIATGGASAGYRGAAIVGGMSGIGFSNRTGSDLIKDAAIGTAFGLGAEKVAKGVGRFVQKMFKRSSPATKEVFESIGETTRPENVKFEAKLIRDAFAGRYDSADNFIKSDVFGKQAQQGLDEAPKLLRNIFKDKRKQLGGQIQGIVDDLNVKTVDVSETVDSFKKALKENLRASGPDKGAMHVIQREILDGLDDGTFGRKLGEEILDINNMSPAQATEFKRSIQEIVFADTDASGAVNMIKNSPRANQVLSDFANSITEQANNLDPSGRLREVNRQFSQLAQAEQFIPRGTEAHKLLRLQDSVSPTKAGGEMRQFVQLMEGIDPVFNAQVIKEINPRLSAFRMHQAANFQGGTVSTMFRAKAGAAAGKPAGIVGEAAGFALGAGDAALMNIANITARARKAFKVPRDISGVFANSDMIVSKLSQVSPTMAITLSDAVSEGDENMVEELIKQVMQHPEAKKEFEQGIGFNGKAVTPEEVAQVRQEILSSSMPLSEKIRSINELETKGIIPQPEIAAPQLEQPSMQTIKRKNNIDNMNKVKLIEKGLE